MAYAVAKQLGFDKGQVTWVKVPFNNSYAPGAKNFDFDINQISITPARAKVVDFSDGYYTAAQARDRAQGLAGRRAPPRSPTSKDLKLGAQTGTTSLTAIRDDIQPDTEPLVFEDTNAAKQALLNGQVDAIVADLPTAFYITAVRDPEQHDRRAVPAGRPGSRRSSGCSSRRATRWSPASTRRWPRLKSDGTLAAIEKKWLSDVVERARPAVTLD